MKHNGFMKHYRLIKQERLFLFLQSKPHMIQWIVEYSIISIHVNQITSIKWTRFKPSDIFIYQSQLSSASLEYNLVRYSMEKKQFKLRRMLSKKIEDYFKTQEESHGDKKLYNPGLIKFENSQHCECRVVNFFGDIHTETFSLKVNHDDSFVAVGCSNGQAKVYDIMEGKVVSLVNTSRKSGFPCTGVRWKPKTKSQFVTVNCDGTVKWYNMKQESAYGHHDSEDVAYLCCDYQILEEWCVLGTDSNTLEIFDNQTMKILKTYEAGGPSQLNTNHHTNRVFSVKCLPEDPHLFFSGGWDSTVQVWDVRVPDGSVRKICGPSVSSDSLDLHKNILLAGNYQNNNIAQLYNFKSGELIETLDIKQPPNSNSYCFSASFAHKSEYNLMAVGLSGSNQVKIFKDNQVVNEIKFQAAPLALDFSRFHNKDFLIVSGVEGTIYQIEVKIL